MSKRKLTVEGEERLALLRLIEQQLKETSLDDGPQWGVIVHDEDSAASDDSRFFHRISEALFYGRIVQRRDCEKSISIVLVLGYVVDLLADE